MLPVEFHARSIAHPSYSLNRLAGDLLPPATMDVRGETKGKLIRGHPYTRRSIFWTLS